MYVLLDIVDAGIVQFVAVTRSNLIAEELVSVITIKATPCGNPEETTTIGGHARHQIAVQCITSGEISYGDNRLRCRILQQQHQDRQQETSSYHL